MRLLALNAAEARDAERAYVGGCAGALSSCNTGLERLEDAGRRLVFAWRVSRQLVADPWGV